MGRTTPPKKTSSSAGTSQASSFHGDLQKWLNAVDSPTPTQVDTVFDTTSYSYSHEPSFTDSYLVTDPYAAQYFNDAFYQDGGYGFGFGNIFDAFVENSKTEDVEAIPDSVIDPRLLGLNDGETLVDHDNEFLIASEEPPQDDTEMVDDAELNPTTPIPPTTPTPISDLLATSTPFAKPNVGCVLRRGNKPRTKKEESTYDHSTPATSQAEDPRLYDVVRRGSFSFRCPPPTPTKNLPRYVGLDVRIPAAPGLIAGDGSFVGGGGGDNEDFLASVDASLLDPTFAEMFSIEITQDSPFAVPAVVNTASANQAPLPSNLRQLGMQMLVPYNAPIQPCEKRKRGRPKKDGGDGVRDEVPVQAIQPMIPFHAKYHPAPPQPLPMQNFQPPVQSPMPQPSNLDLSPGIYQFLPTIPIIPQFSTAPGTPCTPSRKRPLSPSPSTSSTLTPTSASINGSFSKRRLTINGTYRSLSKKEQAYMSMDSTVTLYDQSNIHQLLFSPHLKPGRTPCYWIQRHPYANTKIYSDHYRTWCRYRHCRGVDTTELIRTATGEMKEKNYKHPRTIIAGNYQVAVDWEFVADESATFANDESGQYAYDKRNVYDSVECFFHLRCFEELVDLPGLVRSCGVNSGGVGDVRMDHRVLGKDGTRNKITKRKNKGGTNAAEVEWYLKSVAEEWFAAVRRGEVVEGLEGVLLGGKRAYNERKKAGKLAAAAAGGGREESVVSGMT